MHRPINTRLNPKYTVRTVKFGGGNITVWWCFSWIWAGPLCQMVSIMDRFQYSDILQTVMLLYAINNLPESWQFQQDNDPKRSSKLVKDWFDTNSIQVLQWPAQSLGLKLIENLRGEIKRQLASHNY